ncbi:MAG: hypothetical protein AAFQ90_12130 [Pseudomonadota bacterium]
MSEAVILIIVGAVGVLSYAMTGVGCATLGYLWFPRLPVAAGALLGSLPAPVLIAVSVLLVATAGPGNTSIGPLLGAIAIICGPGIVIGWPCAFLTLRALHRRIERAGVTAQEVFA